MALQQIRTSRTLHPATLALGGVVIFAGAVTLLFSKGSAVGSFIADVVVVLVQYPIADIKYRIPLIAFATPVLFVSLLPFESIWSGSFWSHLALALLAASTFFCFSVISFALCVQRYQSKSYIGTFR